MDAYPYSYLPGDRMGAAATCSGKKTVAYSVVFLSFFSGRCLLCVCIE